MLQLMTRLRSSSAPRAHTGVSHGATLHPLPTRKRTAARRNHLHGNSLGVHTFIAHDALGGLADVHRINSRNV